MPLAKDPFEVEFELVLDEIHSPLSKVEEDGKPIDIVEVKESKFDNADDEDNGTVAGEVEFPALGVGGDIT